MFTKLMLLAVLWFPFIPTQQVVVTEAEPVVYTYKGVTQPSCPAALNQPGVYCR